MEKLELNVDKDSIEFVLKEEMCTNESDEVLLEYFLKIYHPRIEIPFKNIVSACNLLTRIRRKFNQEWKYLPQNPQVLYKRRILQRAFADEYRTLKWEISDQSKTVTFNP